MLSKEDERLILLYNYLLLENKLLARSSGQRISSGTHHHVATTGGYVFLTSTDTMKMHMNLFDFFSAFNYQTNVAQ